MFNAIVHRNRRWASMLGLTIIFVLGARSWAQSGTEPGESARAALEAFRRIDSRGERLTKEGWFKGAAAFVRPDQRPKEQTFKIIANESIGQTIVKGNRAEVWTEDTDWGTVDSMGRFSRAVGRVTGPAGPGDSIEGPSMARQPYTLLFSDTYWELNPDGSAPKQVKGKAAWRIESFDPGPLVEIDFALRYLATLSNSSSDSTIRRNAARSIAAIRHLVRSSAGTIR